MTIEQASCVFRVGPPTASGTWAEDLYRVAPGVVPSPMMLFKVEPRVGSDAALGLGPPVLDVRGVSAPQEAQWVVSHGVTEYWGGSFDLREPIAVQIQPEGVAWNFAIQGWDADESVPWAGWEVNSGGVSLGDNSLSLELAIEIGGETVRFPVVTDGRAWSSSRQILPIDGSYTHRAEGYLSRFADVEVSYAKAVGDTKYHGEIVRAILVACGIPSARIGIPVTLGWPLEAALEFQCEPGVPRAAGVLKSAGYVLTEDGAGDVIARGLAPVDEQPVMTIDAARLDTSEVEARVNADNRSVPVCVIVEGQRPEPVEQGDGWQTITREESVTRQELALPIAEYSQAASGALTALGGTTGVRERITERITSRELYYKGCLVERRRYIERLYNPEVWRYQTESPATIDGKDTVTGDWGGYNIAYIFTEGAAKDDTAAAYQYPHDKLLVVAIEFERYERDGAGDPGVSLGPPPYYVGRLIKKITATGGWTTVERTWKSYTSAILTWETENVNAGIELLGSGTPIATNGFSQEMLFAGPLPPGVGAPQSVLRDDTGMARVWSSWATYAETDITNVDVETDTSEDRPGGWKTGEVSANRDYERTDGAGHVVGNGMFLDGETSVDPEEQGKNTGTTTINYVPETNNTHTRITAVESGESVGLETKVDSAQAGYLPVADVCFPELQSLGATVSVRSRFCLVDGSGNLDTRYSGRKRRERFDFGVETEAQARDLARTILRHLSALRVPVSMPINPLLRAKTPILLEAAYAGIDSANYPHPPNAWVEDVEHQIIPEDDSGASVRMITRATLCLPVL